MEDKENAVDTKTTADRHQQQQRGVGGMLKDATTTHGAEMLPLGLEASHSLHAAAAAATATVAATPRSIGGARVAHFAATPLGQRMAGEASSVRRERDEKRNGTQAKAIGEGDGARRQTVLFSSRMCAPAWWPTEAFSSRFNRVASDKRS